MEEVLNAPDAVGGVGGPWRELLGKGAQMGPLAGFGERAGVVAGGAETGELGLGQGGGDNDVA